MFTKLSPPRSCQTRHYSIGKGDMKCLLYLHNTRINCLFLLVYLPTSSAFVNMFPLSLNAMLALSLVILLLSGSDRVQAANLTDPDWPYQSYRTTDFHPPELSITKPGTPADGYLFIGQAGPKVVEAAPLIMTDDNELVWQGPGHLTPFNFYVQTYQGNPVLVYWNGTLFAEPVGRGYGAVYILNQNYEQIAEVTLGGTFLTLVGQLYPSNIDVHEIYITDNDTMLVTANNVTQSDLTSVGGPSNGWTVDAQVYEIDIATNQILFQWSALDHLSDLPMNLSQDPLGAEGYDGTKQSTAWNYFHINSVAPFDDGYIISSRYLCMAIAIDRQGAVKWRLSGKTGLDFTLGPSTNFCYQHDIRLASGDPSTNFTISMHNNANSPVDFGHAPSTGLLLDVSLPSRSVSLNQRLLNPLNPVYSPAQGSYQPIPGSTHVLVDHGWDPVFEEYCPTNSTTGVVVMTATFGPYNNTSPAAGGFTLSYRVYRQPWTGCPATTPSITTAPENGGVAVYVSWNGATEVEAWNLYAGAAPTDLYLTASVQRLGRFESRVVLPAQMVVNGSAVVQTAFVRAEAVVKAGAKCQGIGGGGGVLSGVVGAVNGSAGYINT